MLCCVSFPIKGHLRLSVAPPIKHRIWLYEFERDADGFAVRIKITSPVPQQAYWPRVDRNPAPGVAAHISCESPHLVFIRKQLAVLQGVLCLYGVEQIDLESVRTQWLPETIEEKAALQVIEVTIGSEPVPRSAIECLPFDVVARAVLALDRLDSCGLWCNLFRRARLALSDHDYIDAIRYLYFVLESTLSGGQWRSGAVAGKLARSTELRAAFQEALHDSGPITHPERLQWAEAIRKWHLQGFEPFVRHIVQLRGRVQHHSGVDHSEWHPEYQLQFREDALFLQSVILALLLARLEPHLWHPEVIKQYEMLRGSAGS